MVEIEEQKDDEMLIFEGDYLLAALEKGTVFAGVRFFPVDDRSYSPGSYESEFVSGHLVSHANAPWKDAKTGEIWVLTTRHGEEPYKVNRWGDFTHAIHGRKYYLPGDGPITAGYRIWPKDEDAKESQGWHVDMPLAEKGGWRDEGGRRKGEA